MSKKLTYDELEDLNVEINLPASKSISNRALIIEALCQGKVDLQNISEAADSKILQSALKNKSLKKHIGMAGTAARFLSAYLATQKSSFILTGDDRMQKRPMKVLLDALQDLGAKITYIKKEGFLPIQINGSELKGGEAVLDATVSSQFITALMLIAPTLEGGLRLNLEGKLSSAPYVQMTQTIMNHFGIEIEIDEQSIIIREQAYEARPLTIESDWSSASYLYSALALMDEGSILLKNLSFDSWQGDEITADIYYRLGVISSKVGDDVLLEKSDNIIDFLDYDFIDCPDLAQSVICACVGLGIEGEFSGLHTLKGKETNRIEALQNELKKLNWILEEGETGVYHLRRNPIVQKVELSIQCYNDHRMAMAFAPLCIVFNEIEILSPEVVKKSFPQFWVEFEKLGVH